MSTTHSYSTENGWLRPSLKSRVCGFVGGGLKAAAARPRIEVVVGHDRSTMIEIGLTTTRR